MEHHALNKRNYSMPYSRRFEDPIQGVPWVYEVIEKSPMTVKATGQVYREGAH